MIKIMPDGRTKHKNIRKPCKISLTNINALIASLLRKAFEGKL